MTPLQSSVPRQIFVETPNGRFSVYEWLPASADRSEAVVLVHANGFHARCWDRVAARLAPFRVVAPDLRGHGDSEKRAFDDWFAFADDLRLVLRAMGIQQALGVGHSLGGFCCTAAACDDGTLFRELLLIDPVILSPGLYARWDPASLSSVPQHFVAKRRSRFASLQEFRQRLVGRTPYDLFDAGVFDDYCRFALRPLAGSGEFELACAPAFEARIYETAFANGCVLDGLSRLQMPVSVVRAMQAPSAGAAFDFRYSPTWPELAAQIPRGCDLHVPQYTHFLPLQDPAWVAGFVQSLAAS